MDGRPMGHTHVGASAHTLITPMHACAHALSVGRRTESDWELTLQRHNYRRADTCAHATGAATMGRAAHWHSSVWPRQQPRQRASVADRPMPSVRPQLPLKLNGPRSGTAPDCTKTEQCLRRRRSLRSADPAQACSATCCDAGTTACRRWVGQQIRVRTCSGSSCAF